MTEQERAVEPAASPYLCLRQAVRPAILAHRLLAGDRERAGQLAAECEDLLYLTRELVKAAGRARILTAGPGPERPDESGGDRQVQLLDAYADAGLLWAKVVGSALALARVLIERGDWDDVRRLAGCLARAGEDDAALELRIEVGKAVWARHDQALRAISNAMPPTASGRPSMRCGPCCARCPRISPTGTGKSTASWHHWPRPSWPS